MVALIYTGYQLKQAQPLQAFNSNSVDSFVEPSLPIESPWSIRSIDTQIISKYWPNVPSESIKEQVTLLKNLKVNYIAIDTPYDKKDELYKWANEIHNQHLHIWFRSHWDNWEGNDGKPASMTPQEYLDKTEEFIRSNPDLFKEGDSFTLAVEPEQTGVGLGKKFRDWNEYRQFILNEVIYANKGFKSINFEGKIYTNWISVNGWVVQNEFNTNLVSKLGLIVIDHYSKQSNTIGLLDQPNKIASDMSSDLDSFHAQWNTPILLGEWGYQIYQDTDDITQAAAVQEVFNMLKTKQYLIGVNYWSHMGNHSRLIDDKYGSNLTYRKSATVIGQMYLNSNIFEATTSTSTSVLNTPKPLEQRTNRRRTGNFY